MQVMDRGEFFRAAEQRVASADEANFELMVSDMKLELLGKVAENARVGGKWASIITVADGNSRSRHDAYSALMTASDSLQHDGFQTDEAYLRENDRIYHQLTVFWADGKNIYENDLHLLGTFDPELLAEHRQ